MVADINNYITVDPKKAFMPKEFSVILTDDKGRSTDTININSKDPETGYIPDDKINTIKELTVQWRKIPGFFYTNQPYDISSEPNYLPWKRLRSFNVTHVNYPKGRTYPLNQENTGFTQNLISSNVEHGLIPHNEDYSPIMTLFNVGNNYLSLENLDHYIQKERLLSNVYSSERSVINGTMVGAFSDSRDGVTLGYKEDFTNDETRANYLTTGYTTRRRGDQLTRYTTYLFDYLGDEVYTENKYKEDIVKGIGAQKFSLPNNYNGYRKYIKNTQPGFNDYRPVIPLRGGYIHGYTDKLDKSLVSGNVLTYDKDTNRYFFLKQNTEIDIVTLDETRNYYTVKNLSDKIDRELKSIHPNLAKRLKRHHYPLRGLIHSSTPRPKSYSGDKLSDIGLEVYPWDKSRISKIYVQDMFTTCVQYINWLPGRFPFVMNKENTRVTIRKDHPFRVLNAHRDMIINAKKEITIDFPMDLVAMYKDKVNFEFLDQMPTYTETMNNRHIVDRRLDTSPTKVGSNKFYYIHGLLYQEPIPERTTYGASEIINYKPLKDLGVVNKSGLSDIAKLWWDNDYPGYFHTFEENRTYVTKGTKRGWYHYYCTEDRDNSNKNDSIFRYLFSEPIPQREKVGDGGINNWSEGDLCYSTYQRGLQDSDITNSPEKVFVDTKYKDIFYRNGGYQAGGLVNCKRRYKVVAAFGTGNRETDEVVGIHYWNHNLNLTDDVYDYVQIADTNTQYCVNSSSSDRRDDSRTDYYIGTDNRLLYSFYHWGSLANVWVYFEVDNEIIYQAKISNLYGFDYYRDLDSEKQSHMPNSKGSYFLAKRKMPVFDLDGKKVIFANYCFTKGEFNTFIKDSPLFYYEEEAKQGKYVIPEKYKAIQDKIDRGMPLKVYMHFHPDKDYWKNPTPVMGVTPNPFYGNQVFDFTKPPKLVGETKYINTTCDFGYNGNDGIVITLDNSMNAVNNRVYRQYEINVSVTIFDERKDAYVTKVIKTNDYLDQATFVKKANKLFTNKIILKSFETKLEGNVESPFDLDNGYPRLDASTTKITSTEYDRLKANKDSKILKVEINVKPKYQGTYTRDFKTTYEFDYAYYFKNHTLVT